MASIVFKLYIAGQTPRSQRAVANLHQLVQVALSRRCELVVVDVIADPAAAEADQILTTPTLIRVEPAPPRRVTGDLSDAAKVLYGLGLNGLLAEHSERGGEG